MGDANGARAHPNAQGIDTSIDQIFGLRSGDHVAAYKLELRVPRFDAFDHVDLINAVALRGILRRIKKKD